MQPPWMLKPPVVQLNLRNLSRGEDSDEMTILTIEDFLKTHSGKLEIYTDGSRANDGSASCFFVVSSMSIERNFRLSNKTSIHAAEMMAIKLALEWATLVDHHQLVIYSDFLDVWQAIEQRQSNKGNRTKDPIYCEICSLHTKCIVEAEKPRRHSCGFLRIWASREMNRQTLWDVMAPWLSQFLSTGGSWIRLPL